jgi:hypothetical protein
MSKRIGSRCSWTLWRVLPLLVALVFSTTLPRAFVVCVSEDDHVSLEALFEGDPCETNFIFGAGREASWPTASCTDIPAIQLSTLADASPSIVDPPTIGSVELSAPTHDQLPARPEIDTALRPLRELRALRTTVLRI